MPRHAALTLVATLVVGGAATCLAAGDDVDADFAAIFDTHWEALRDGYPYFGLYGVDWVAERAEHRPRALAAASVEAFHWELCRMLAVLPDAHTSYVPPVELVKQWSVPMVRAPQVERRSLVVAWHEGFEPEVPEAFRDDPHAYPEVVSVEGCPLGSGVEILVAGPVGTPLTLRLRWPDGTETDQVVHRPDEPNLPPPDRHFGERWIGSGRVGEVGYLRVRSFNPSMGTLGPEGKMTPILRRALRELGDTRALILDVQGNGGGVVAASDPFLRHFLERSQSYRWGNSGGQRRTLTPRSPRYEGDVVVLVDERSASGGEWAARILRDAGRATVIGGRTVGAEAAVLTSEGPDGSVLSYSGWPMVEPGVTPFQHTGVALDHELPLTVDDVRAHGYDEALARIRRARFAKALEVLGAPAEDVDAFVALKDGIDAPPEEASAATSVR